MNTPHVSVVTNTSAVTRYTHRPRGDLASVTDALGNVVETTAVTPYGDPIDA